MADVDDNNFIRYIYRGEEDEIIPRETTHITVAEDCTFVRARAFRDNPNIVEVVCHEDVEKIETAAFANCRSLKRVIMPGVKIVEGDAFDSCTALADVECDKLEIIRYEAFCDCDSLRNINLPSVRILEEVTFAQCALIDVTFGSNLERIDEMVFKDCYSLERITIPLKDVLITADNVFQGCRNLMHVDPVETAELHEFVAALNLEEWRNDMNREIDSINRILPNTPAGDGWNHDEEKTRAIRRWIRSVLRKIIHYRAQHQRILNQAATQLQFALPQDILANNVLPFLALPSHSFEVDDLEEDADDSDDE